MEIGMAVLWTVKSSSPIWSRNSTSGHGPGRTDSRVSHTPVFIVASFTWRPSSGLWAACFSFNPHMVERSWEGSTALAQWPCVVQGSSLAQSCLTLCNPRDYSTPGFPVLHHLLEFAQTLVHWVSDAIQLPQPLSSLPLLLLPSIFPSIMVFSSESILCIRWPKYWIFNFSISPSNGCLGLISFRIDWFDLLAVQGTLKSFLQHHSSKAFGNQPSLWFNSHIHTWLLEKP